MGWAVRALSSFNCGALDELRAITDAYCLIDGAANAEVLQESRQAYDDLQIELYLLEQELVRRQVVRACVKSQAGQPGCTRRPASHPKANAGRARW